MLPLTKKWASPDRELEKAQILSKQELSPSLVWDQVEHIAASPGFRQSARMVRFLRHVVQAALAKSEGDLKETAIGAAVYDRDATYDPKIDPVVRNEARRLRQKLARYYEEEGCNHTIVIELPKGGYAPVFHLDTRTPIRHVADRQSPEDLTPQEQTNTLYTPIRPKRLRSGRRFISAFREHSPLGAMQAAALIIGLLILAIWISTRKSSEVKKLTFPVVAIPFTSVAGQASQPSISADGKNLAFVWDDTPGSSHVYLMQKGGTPLRITSGLEYDLRPAWSPDGQQITYLSAKGIVTDVMLIAIPGGQERRLFSLHSPLLRNLTPDLIDNLGSPGPAWEQNGNGIIVSDQGLADHSLALYEHNLSTGTVRRLTNPEGEARDFWPRISPDGRFLLFVRSFTNSASDLYLMSFADGSTRRLTNEHADIRGASWLGNDQQVLFSSNRSGYYSLWVLDLLHNSINPLPAPGESATDPVATLSGDTAVYTDSSSATNVRMLRLGAKTEPDPVEFAQSSRRTNSAQFSPDGRQVAFTSDRSGSWEVWVAESDGTHASQLTHFNGPMLGTLHWSPDGKSIAFDARPYGYSSLFVISSDGSNLRRLSQNAFEERQPYWSHNGQWLYFSSTRTGQTALWRESTDGQRSNLICQANSFDPQESADGSSVFFTSSGPGIWHVSTAGGTPRVIEELKDLEPNRLWQLTSRGIFFIDPVNSPTKVQFYDFSDKKVREIVSLPFPASGGAPSLSVSPDYKQLLITAKDRSNSNIVLLQSLHRH